MASPNAYRGQRFDIHLPTRPPRAAVLLLGGMILEPAFEHRNLLSVREAWRTLHTVNWTKTLVVSRTLMDRVAPPRREICIASVRAVETSVSKRYGKDTARRLIADLEELWPVAADDDEVVGGMAERCGIPLDDVRRTVRRIARTVSYTALGACVSITEESAAELGRRFPNVELAPGERVCLLDCQRIRATSQRVLRSGEANNPYMLSGALGWIVWFHEQSHATRPSNPRAEEEVMAQVEAYRLARLCPLTPLHPPLGLPDGPEVMKRLARRQPSPYRTALDGDFLRAIGA